jgi:putative ABC transport system permease protein
MELGPIFRALFKSRTRFFLVVTEIALTLAIVVNCMNMIADQRNYLTRPTGLDEENLLVITSETFAPEFEDDGYTRNAYLEDLAAVRAMPGVSAAAGISAIPLSGGGSSTGRRALGSEGDTISVPYFTVSPEILETLGVELASGRSFRESDWGPAEERERRRIEAARLGLPAPEDDQEVIARDVLVTKSIAEAIYPDQDPLGKVIASRDGLGQDTIVGVIELMHCAWPLSSVHDRAMLRPGLPYSNRRSRYMVRAEPGAITTLYTALEEKLLEVNSGRIVTVATLKEIKHENMEEVGAMIKMLSGISFLLVTVTSLGIIGLTAFSVTQRTRQIGTRRALGATRWAVLRYFLVENWVITSIGLGFGLLLTYGLNFALAQVAGLPMITFPLMASGMVILWLVGLAATLASSLRSMSVSPVLATRTI